MNNNVFALNYVIEQFHYNFSIILDAGSIHPMSRPIRELSLNFGLKTVKRAALSKPAGESVPPFTKRAYIVNGRHITTFDGKTFSIQGGNNCNLLLAKDFGRTGSSISLVNGKLNQKIDPNSGFTVEKKGDIITIIAAGRLHGNVAGALGTIVSNLI